MLKKYLLAITIFLINVTKFNAQNKQPEERLTCNMRIKSPQCYQPQKPKGTYYQHVEQYSDITKNDSLSVRYMTSELSVIISLNKRKKATMLVRQCSPNCTYPNPFKYLYEKKGSWSFQDDTVTIIWKYQRDTLSSKWLCLIQRDTFKLKYERDYKTNYPVIDCKSALTPKDKNPFIGYGN